MINKNIKEAAIEVYKEEGMKATITFLKKREIEDTDIADFLQEHCEATGCPTKELNGDVCANCENGSVLDFCSECNYEKEQRQEVSGTTMGDMYNFLPDSMSYVKFSELEVGDEETHSENFEEEIEAKPKKPNFIKRLFGLK